MTITQPPQLEPRFHQPAGWRWHHFERQTPRGVRRIRFGSVSPNTTVPRTTIIALQGVRECTEKYFELAQWCLDQGYAFWMMDWFGQGCSTRPLKNPQKRHSTGFQDDIDDLHYFITEYIKHASVHPEVGRIPMTMLAHSMGGNIGLRYMIQHPDIFTCAALTAPMTGIKVFQKTPNAALSKLLYGLNTMFGTCYVPAGKNWRAHHDYPRLSQDPVRKGVQNAWLHDNPVLQSGDVTMGWLHAAHKTCIALHNEIRDNPPTIPCLIGLAEHEDLVDNAQTRRLCADMDNATCLELQGAYHEILMERDDIRNHFLNTLRDMIDTHMKAPPQHA